MLAAAEIKRLLEAGIPGARVDVVDTTGGGDHFQADVVAAAFAGRSRIEQHRMVYAALGTTMQQVHALALTTRAPEE